MVLTVEAIDKKGKKIDVARVCFSEGKFTVVMDWDERLYFKKDLKSVKVKGDL